MIGAVDQMSEFASSTMRTMSAMMRFSSKSFGV